ncbi:MAG: PIN domain-containing protein [Cyanobacteria bacterium]|nr:PIN domain-containing protein [Cyanobacteriota bacterium]
MRVLIDTSCLVAFALPQHLHHAPTASDLDRRRSAGQQLVVASHAIVEAYSVLTRMPPPFRLTPSLAIAVLDHTWGKAETFAATAAECWRMLRLHAGRGVIGGRIYDGVIAECARKAKADAILTWNIRHFEGSGVAAVSPRV